MPIISRSINAASERVSHAWSISVPAGHVWRGLTDPEALPRRMGKLTSGKFVRGNAVTVQHAGSYFCSSCIREYEPERLLKMTWRFPDENALACADQAHPSR